MRISLCRLRRAPIRSSLIMHRSIRFVRPFPHRQHYAWAAVAKASIDAE
jgi:hypothetical protein